MIEITRASGTGYFTLPFPRGIGIDLVDPPTSRSASDSRLLAGTPDTHRASRTKGGMGSSVARSTPARATHAKAFHAALRPTSPGSSISSRMLGIRLQAAQLLARSTPNAIIDPAPCGPHGCIQISGKSVIPDVCFEEALHIQQGGE